MLCVYVQIRIAFGAGLRAAVTNFGPFATLRQITLYVLPVYLSRRRIAMRRFAEMRRAAVSLQKFSRGFLARKLYLRLLRQKREEEERKRREEEEKERRRREELLRLEMENKKREAQLLKKQLEEEEARKVLVSTCLPTQHWCVVL